MPYFNVQINESVRKEFVVFAANRDAVETVLAASLATEKFDSKKIIHTRTDTDSSMSVYDADKSNWTEALKRAKAK
jgi:hypothetical protein